MTETVKIGRACFIGGATLCTVALLVVPTLWWLGIIAGFCAGYLAYEFGEVVRAIPVAFHKIAVEMRENWAILCYMVYNIRLWFSQPHPYIYGSLVMGILLGSTFVYVAFPFANPSMNNVWGVAFSLFIFSLVGYLLSLALLGYLTFIGTDWDANYAGDQPDTYANVYRWVGLGLARIFVYLLWRFWAHLGIGIGKLVRLIHSHKRTLCAVDGTLGGVIALIGFFYYGPVEPTVNEYLMVVLSGGFIGATLGMANWEIVSKRVFGFGMPSV